MARSPRSPRGSLAAFVIATLLLPCALLSFWVSATVTDTDRYVSTVAPLASDPVLKAAAERELERAALRLIDFDRQKEGIEALLRERTSSPLLRQGVAVLTNVARAQAIELVHKTVVKIVESPYFTEAWSAANRSAHEQLVAVLDGDDQSLVDAKGRVTIELATVLGTVAAALKNDGLVNTDRLPNLEASFPLVKANDLAKARIGYELLKTLGFWLSALWLLAVSAAILLAPHRRRRIMSLAWASAAAAIVIGLALGWLRNKVSQGVADPAVIHSVWDILVVDLRRALRTILVLSAIALVAAWLVGWSSSNTDLGGRLRTAGKAAAVQIGGLTRQQLVVGVALLSAAILTVIVW